MYELFLIFIKKLIKYDELYCTAICMWFNFLRQLTNCRFFNIPFFMANTLIAMRSPHAKNDYKND